MKFESTSEKSLFSTIRIETRLTHGDFITGTAFVYEFATEDNSYPFLVTARTLIEQAQEGRITLIQGENRSPIVGKGYTLDIENFSKLWFCHPNESLNIAVTPFVPFVKHVENTGVTIFFEAFNEHTLCTFDNADDLSIGEDILYLGYPDKCWDHKHLLPVFRKAMMSLPHSIDFQGKPQSIIDSNVLHGSCGSPVFVKSRFTADSIDGSLLGLLSSIPEQNGDNDELKNEFEDASSQTDMGVVIKMEVVVEAITAYLKEKGFI